MSPGLLPAAQAAFAQAVRGLGFFLIRMLAKLAAADARLTLEDMVAEFAPDKREAV